MKPVHLTPSRIIGTGSAFPEGRLTNQILTERLVAQGLETSDTWMLERTGIRERRIAQTDTTGAVVERERNSSLAARAAIQAMEMAGCTADTIDVILYGTCTPDTLIPSSACWLQMKIGAHRAACVDLNAACSGFVYALAHADLWIRGGAAKRVLVVGSDVLSSFTDWKDRTSCILFGDGAGAAIVEAQPDSQSLSRVIGWKLHSDGRLWDHFHIPAGGSALPATPALIASGQTKMQMKGREIFKAAVRTLSDFAVELLEEHHVSIQEVKWILPHQANLRIIEAVAKRLEFPMERILINIEQHGNTSAATVATLLDQAVRDGRIQRGDLLLLDVFGAGLTYGALLMRW